MTPALGSLRLLAADGWTAEVYAWGDDRILKLFRKGWASVAADREAAHARLAHAAGIPTPAVVDVIRIGNRVGVIFERTDGPTLLEALAEGSREAVAVAEQLATLHADLHARDAQMLPPLRRYLRACIARARRLTREARTAAQAALDVLPDGGAICHGDFHPGNVILTAAGPVVIDWLQATRGDPVADVARTSLLLECAEPPAHLAPPARAAIAGARRALHAAYLRRYAELRPISREQLAAWTLPVAAARLSHNLPAAESERLLSRLHQLLGER